MHTLKDAEAFAKELAKCEYISAAAVRETDLSCGKAAVAATIPGDLFIKIIGEAAGIPLENEGEPDTENN